MKCKYMKILLMLLVTAEPFAEVLIVLLFAEFIIIQPQAEKECLCLL